MKDRKRSLKNKSQKETQVKTIDVDGKTKLLGVIFAPYTENSELAKRWRAKIETFEKVGDLRLKVVERTGDKLTDLLHKSNICEDNYCDRKDCLICMSTSEEEKKGMCKKRNVIYETYCITCMKKEKYEKEMRETTSETKVLFGMLEINGVCIFDERSLAENKKRKRVNVQNKEKIRETYTWKYIGETGRSGYERGKEHVSDLVEIREKSHLLRHYILKHKSDMRLDQMEYGMKVRSQFRTALERQVGEAVVISREKILGTNLLNSKAEYNRCKIHRIETRPSKSQYAEMLVETENDNIVKAGLKELNFNKRSRKSVKNKSDKSDKSVSKVSKVKKKRKLEQEKYATDKDVSVNALKTIRDKNCKSVRKSKVSNRYRDTASETAQDSFLEKLNYDGDFEPRDSPEKISDIGRQVQLRLGDSVIKRTFSDLKPSDYLKAASREIVNLCETETETDDLSLEIKRMNNIYIETYIFDETVHTNQKFRPISPTHTGGSISSIGPNSFSSPIKSDAKLIMMKSDHKFISDNGTKSFECKEKYDEMRLQIETNEISDDIYRFKH